MGAKNHTSILPDANKNHAVNRFELTLAPGVVTFLGLIPPQHLAHSVVGAAFGAAGQRCMALSVAVMVGETKEWLPEIVDAASSLRVGSGFDPNVDVGPMIDEKALRRAEGARSPSTQPTSRVPPSDLGAWQGSSSLR